MDLYLSNCYKAAEAAATKAAASSLTRDREHCDTASGGESGSHKKDIPEVGAANLLDLPLGVKLPIIPGSNNIFYTTNISEKLYHPSYDFNLSDPYCRLLETSYKSLHDPHLKAYHKRKDILRRLKKGGYITSNNKVICTLKELNKYRQYLTTLKLDFERNYVREQKMIEKQVNKLYETRRAYENYGDEQFQEWLLQEDTQASLDQELIIRHRYLDMISRELGKGEHTAGKQSILRMKEEQHRHQDHIRRKLRLRRQIEEEWKTKEMLLLTKIGDEVKREAKVEEQRQKVRQEAHRKKQALLEKKIAYRLQKMQRDDMKRDRPEENIFENKGQDEREASSKMKKTSGNASDQQSHQEQKQPRHSHGFIKIPTQKSSVFISSPQDVQKNKTELKSIQKDKEMTKTSHTLNDKGIKSSSLQAPSVSAKTEQAILKQEVTYADVNEKKAKKPSFNSKSAQGNFPSHDSSIKHHHCQNCCQKKVTSEELNGIVHNIMTWVVAAVTSILYPAITKYEERLQNILYPMPDDSTLSSDSVSCCSTCSEMLLYETCIQAETFQAEACADTADRSIGQPATPVKPSAHKEKRAMGEKHHRKGKRKDSEPKSNKTTESPKPKTSKSDTHLSAPTETGSKNSEDAITESAALKQPPSSDERAKVVNEMQELKNVFDNFKYHLKEESELVLENIFHEMVSELTKTLPSLASVTAETLVDQTDIDKGGLLSKVSISSAAAEIMESVLEKLQSAVEKKCTEVFSQENSSVHFKSDLTASGEHFISPEEKTSKASPPYTMENMSGIAEDMVHVILEKLTSLASSKQNELAHLEITTKPAYQQHQKDPTYAFLQRASKSKSSAEPNAANLISKEDIQNLVSNIFSQSSLVGYIEEAINTILSYIQIGLNNERLIASEETMTILHLLDDLLAQLHQKPAKTDVPKRRHPRLSSPSGTEEGHRLSSTTVAYHPRHGRLFPPINVPGMVLYSEDENKEIDKIVENVLISSIKDEKAKLQEQVPDRWLTRENADLKYKRNMNLHTKPTYQDEVAFHNWGLKTDLSGFNNKDLFKDKPCLNRDLLLFCEDENHQIQKASEDIITSILAQVLQDLSSGPSDHSGYKNKEASLLTSGSPQDLSSQERMNQMFCASEIQIVAQEIVDAVLKILHIAYSHIIRHSSSVPQTSLDNADIPNKEPLKIWLESKRNMKCLSVLGIDPTKDPWLEPEETESTPEPIVHINDKITYTVFKKLNSFICPKLQNCFKLESHADHSKPEPDKKSSFQSHLSTYTTKVVKIVLDAIQKELKYNKKNLKLGKCGPPKDFIDTGDFADSEKELDSLVTKLNNDIMTSSLATCICELLSGNTDKSNILLPSDKLRSKISYETAEIEQKQRVPSQCPHMQEEVHRGTRLQLLDRIGDTLCDMLHKLIGYCPHSPRSDEPNREWIKENLRITTALQSNIQLISYTILEGIIGKFCSAEMDHIFTNSEFKAISDYIDTDSLSFALLIEEMGRCSDIIASMLSSMIQPSSQEVTNNNGKTTAPKTGTTKEEHPNKLEVMASDIFEMVFAKLKGFAQRNLETLGTVINGNKKSNKRYWESESFNICANTREKQLESALYMHAKKVSSTILKAIQTELNVSLLDLETGITKPLQEKEMLKNLVDLILDAEPPQLFNETESEKQGIENYRYRPTYGNFLPGGADPESYLEDPADTEKKSAGEERPTEETKSESLQQWELERTFKKFEVELKEPEKSPVVPIIRNILNEIFQNDLIDQLNVLTLSQSPLCDIPHPGDKPVAQKSIQSMDKIMAPLVSEADITAVADNVVRTILQKLYSAVMTDRNASENRSNIITCPAIISFPEYDNEEKTSLQSTILDRNPCIFQSTFSGGKMTKMNVVEDIIQSILTNLETFATSKVKALFCPHINFTIPTALPLQEDETASSQPWLSTKDSYSGDQFSYCSMDHDKSGKTTSICQLTACKLNSYATEVARQILQGIKHKLDKEIKSPFLIHNIVVSGSIPSQIVNTVLSIVSAKGKYEKNLFDREIEPGQPEDIVGKLFNKSDYQKKLQFQILGTIEGILSDICEKTLDENNLLLTASTLNKFNVSGKHLEANSETNPKYANKAIPMLLVPKSCVTMISNDMVDIVLQNLTSAIMLGVNAKDSISLKLPLAFSDSFPKAEHQRSTVTDSMNEGERGRFLFARKGRDVQLKSVYSDDYQTTVLKKQDDKKSADPCEESVHFITKAISNRLKSFATERIDMLLTLDTQTTEKTYVGPELTNCNQNSVFLEANQMPSDVNILEISTARTVLSQEVTDDTFANYRKKHGPAIHISQACLREYADIIASTILMLIKNDIDLEIQKMYSYPNNTSFQENIIASETVNNILRNLHDKISLKATKFYSQQNPSLFTQLVVQNEILPGQRKMDDNTELSLFSKYPYQNQIISEAENLRRVLEEIFRNGDSRQEKTALLSAVKEILKKVYQRVMEDIDHWLPFTERPHFTFDSKMKTSAARKKTLQSHISSVANDIVESVSRKMFSIVMTCLYEKKETRKELEASGHDELLLNPSSFQESKQAERRSVPPEHVILRVCPYTGIRSVTSLENTLLQFSPWRVGEELVHKVLKKITNFVLLNLEENLSPKDQSDGMQSPRPCSSNASLKDNPNTSFKTNLKAKSEVISLPKCGTKPQLGPSGAKAKSKSKLSPREKTFRGSQSSTAIGLPYLLSDGDAKNSLVRTKLPTAEFKMHAKDIVSNILEKIVNEFQKVRQNRLMVNVDTLTSDQIMTASKIVNAVLQGLYAMKNDNSADQIKGSHSHDLKPSQRKFRTISLANPEVHFSLETVSSQLEKIFPKEGIFTQMFDEWQTESNDMGNEKYKLLMVAESVLNEILVKTKELEQSVSLLNLSPLEAYESRCHNFKRAASGTENSQAQIRIFGQEIVKKLLEKLDMYFMTQMFIKDGKEMLESKKETTARSQGGSLRTNNLNNVPIYDTKLKDKIYEGSSHQIAQELVGGVLNTFESFADLQFKQISTYAFSEIVKIPIENFFAVQQKPFMKTILPELPPRHKFPHGSKSCSMISQENMHYNTLRQLHSFHLELLTYTANTVNDMLGIIKNKVDKGNCQMEPSSISIFEKNTVASQIISTLMDQCTHFCELMIKSHPKENLLKVAKKAYTANWPRSAIGMGMVPSESKGISRRDDLPQIPGLSFYSEKDRKVKEKASSNLPSNVRYSAEDTLKTTEPLEGLKSELKPLYSRSEAQGLSHFEQVVKGNSSLPLPKAFQKSSDPVQAAPEHPMSFTEMEGENPKVLHYECPKPVKPNHIQTTISPLKIGIAAENIVHTLLLSYGLPSQTPYSNKSIETMKPFFVSKEGPLSMMSEEQKDEKSLLKIWEQRINSKIKEENQSLVASGEDFTLLEKWKDRYPKLEKPEPPEEAEVIAFADQELGPKEIHLVARYVTTAVVTHFKNFETRGPLDEKVFTVSTPLRKKYESKQPLRNINYDTSLYQFCEHLTELVISYIMSSISDCTEDGGTKQKSLENQDAAFSKVILIHSQVFASRSVSIRGLALSISEIIIRILFNSDILKADITQEVVSVKTKYIYCPKVAVADFDNLFQDLLIGVIHVLSKEIGIKHQPDRRERRKPLSRLKTHSLPIRNKTKTLKRQTGYRGWKSSPTHRINQLVQKNKLNSLACKLSTLFGSLKTHESKEVVNKISNISNLVLPDECPNWDMDSGKISRKRFLSSDNQQNHRIPRNNPGLSPKSVFLLNTVCEKFIKILSEECTANNLLTDGPLSGEIPTEGQLLNILQNIENYCRGTMDHGSAFEEYNVSALLENLAEIDQESMLSITSHTLVKSLMEKLSCGTYRPPRSPLFANKHLRYRGRQRLPGFPKGERPKLKESRQDKCSVRFTNYDSKPLREPLNNLTVIHSKMQAPFGKQCSGKFSPLPPLQRPGKKEVNATAILNLQYPGGMNTGVYSATFLEEIIAEIFLNLSTSLQSKNVNITEAQLNEVNILDVNSVVNEFNNARVTVLRDVEERICFPEIHKETVRKIADSVNSAVSWEYALQVTGGSHLTHAATSIAERITNGILRQSVDHQLPLYFVGKLMPNSYYPLKAENILQKLQNNLRELNDQGQHSAGYTTTLSHSFLKDVIRKLLSQLISPPCKALCLGKKYLLTSDFNEVSTCIINKVLSSISKHKIWLTKYDCQHLYTEKSLQNMVESVYNNVLQMSDSLVSVQKNIVSQSPIMIDRMASLIIQEIIENHLQPFLCGEGLPCSVTPLDEISNMVKEVLSEVTESHRPQKPSSLSMGFYPNAFVEDIVAQLLSKVFNPKYNTECELDKITQKIVNSINTHFNKANICILRDDPKQCFPTVDLDTVDELVNSVYENVLQQHGLTTEVDNEEFKDSDIFAENVTNLIVAAISDYLFHPLFSGDLSASSYATLTAENIIQNIFSGSSDSIKSSQHLSPYNTLLPYTLLEDIIRELLSRIFPSTYNMFPYTKTPKGRSGINCDEISSKLISDIRTKISQHEIRFSKDEEETESIYSETESIYSEDDAQHLVDSVFRNMLQNSGSQETVEHDISSNNVLIDRIASYIIKNICQQHLHPFVYGKSLLPPSYAYFDDVRRQHFFAGVYSSAFLEDVISGVLSKIFHRVLGIVQTNSLRDSGKELLETAEKLIYLITEEFSKAQVTILENAKEQLCLPQVHTEVVTEIIDMAYSKVLQEYELEPDTDFLNDTKTLAERVTKIILAEVFDFQIHPDFIAKLPFKSYSRLNGDTLIKRVHYAINKSRLRRQTYTPYTTILSHTHLEKIITQVLDQINPLNCSAEDPDFLQSDFRNTVVRLIDEIMSIISKHAICIIKHGSEKQNAVSEKDIQAMVDAIYADISHSNLYQSLKKDKKGISNIPVTKIASYIIKEIFNHHLESFLSADKTLPSGTVGQTYQQRATDPQQRELLFIVNSAIFLEDVISELLCRILYVFSHNFLAAENPYLAKTNVTNTVTTLVKSIVLEFTTSEILVADHLDENLHFSEAYKEIVKKTVNLIYEKILDDYKSLIHIYRAIQSDAVSFGQKICYLLLGEIYNYQVESLVLGELSTSSYSSLQDEKIIRNVLDSINDDSHVLPSCITVLPRSLLEDMTYKLLAHIFPLSETETELREKEVPLDYEFVSAASKLSDEIITEISEHEIRLATAEEHVESMQLEASENFVNAICNNIMKKFKLENEAQSDTYKNGGLFLRKIAGFIMKEIVDHHLQPFLYDEESLPCDLPKNEHIIEPMNPDKEKILTGFPQASVYSATFLEDVIIDLVSKFYTLPSIAENPKDKEISEKDPMGMAIKFANGLIEEFRKSKIKVLANSGKMFSFPPIDKETVNKISDSVYNEVIEMCGSNNVQKDYSSTIVIEMIAALAKKAISAFKIQPLFSGDWSSTFFSFLNVDNIIQKVQHLPYNTFTKINRSLRENPVSSLEQLPTLTPLTSGLKDIMNTLEIGRGAHYGKENFKKEKTSMKTGSIQEPICTTITSIMKAELTTLASGLVGGVADKKKGDEKKKERSIGKEKENEKASKVTLPTTNTGPDLSMTPRKKESKKKHTLGIKEEKGQRDEVYQHLSSATDDTKNKKVVLEPALKTDKKKSDQKRGSSLEKDDRPSELPSLRSKVRDRKIQEKRRDSPAYGVTDDKQTLRLKHVQNFTESIYRNVLEMSPFQEPEDDSKSPIPLGDKAVYLTQADGKVLAQPASTNPGKHNAPAKEEENKKSEDKEIKSKPSKPDHPPENNRGIFPANFLGDVLSEIVNKLVFNSSLGTDDARQNVTKNVNQTALDDIAMKLIDSLLKEFSDAQIKVLNPGQGSQFLPSADIVSSVPNIHLRQKEPSVDKAPREKKMAAATKKDSSDEASSMANIPSSDKMLVNKIVHSSICNILQEYRSQDSIYKDINSNGGNLARKLANAVIEEIFQHQLNLLLYEEVPEAACLPLESKEVMKKVHKVAQTACKGCQTSSPYTIMLPYEFLENIISSLLSKIFSTVASAKAEISEDNLYTELYFLQMKLISTIMTEISKDKDMIVQYVESLHPNDDEIIQLVVQTIYNNLLPQFGSQKSIQNCVSSGCKILSETIVNLVVQEVAGNQLQNYFSGELTPHQCTEVDSVVENILKDVIQTTEVPQSQPSQAYKLPFHIIEEIAVNFLSKLLSMFPKVGKKQNNSLHAEMQTIISKILSSFQEYLSKSQIIVVPQAKESPTVSLADSTTIEKVVTSVYNSVLRHSGSHISVYKDLMSKSNVLSDIIGFLMVKEISSSELHPQVEEETSSSVLVLEAVKIMEKVVKIIDNLKSKKKPSTKKETVLDARFLEEMLALFLAKLVKLPRASSRDAKNLSKSEVNKIASQLTKSVIAEISRNNISVVAANPEETFLSPESIEIISQIVESVYNQVLQQSGTHEELYDDMKGTNSVFPKEVASLLISKVSNCPLETISSKDSEADLFGDLDLGRIVEKVHEHAVIRGPKLEQKELGQDLSEEELPVKIIPHRGKQPINIDPDIVAEHLGVISIKTQPLEKLQLECLTRTGCSIEALRRVSVSGRSHSMGTPDAGKQKRERRISLDEVGRLNVKPLETASRNSFQNLIKPDITKVELLKDVHSKKDLIIRLVTHDINQEVSENKVEEGLTSDEDEVVLQDVVRELPEDPLEDQVKEDMKPIMSTVAFSKPLKSKRNLKKFLSLGKCCQCKSTVTTNNTEASQNQWTESEETQRTVSNVDVTTSKSLTGIDSSFWKRNTQLSREGRKPTTEPAYYFLHRIMSSSSYSEEELPSFSSDEDDRRSDPSAKITEESFEYPDLENASSIKFITLYQRESALAGLYSSNDGISDADKPSTSKHGSEMMKKVSSALSKVFSRSNANVSKSSSPPPHP
ncbi:fibrous sheath-interacting protein 2-like isoform X2 [Lontra canadensis]|uniref:fibrous sheath-interacting protein 2-like isoform X2 n=1 Tax=Lontra canadensis TaxID=76717 RepID=UPI0013F2C182|nr:fibrous sheath-interacting protein 2-like isoform X2 [Lontra canadensis]